MEKYTIVIPVKNSLETLKYTLQTCLRQSYPNFEILISDNCSQDGTEDYIKGIGDDRIRYIKTERPLSMTSNFEFAVSNVQEGFVGCIGADDGLMPGAIDYVDAIVRRFGVKAVACQYAHFFWPNVPVPQHGRLILNALNVHRNDVEIRRSSEWIKRTLAFKTELYVCDLPSLYYGFVHRSVIDKTVKDGVYFRSITPDAYSAFATAVSVDEYAFSFRPFSIAGISGKSNGLSQTQGGDISKAFVIENVHPIHKDFKFCVAIEIILGEAFCQLKDAFPEATKEYKLDFELMLKNVLANNVYRPNIEIQEALQDMAAMHKINLDLLKVNKLYKLKKLCKRSLNMFSSFLFRGSRYLGMKDAAVFFIENIHDASIALAIMEKSNEGEKILTVRSRFMHRLKQRIFFLSSKDSI